MKVVYPYGRRKEAYLTFDDWTYEISESLVKQKFRMLEHWYSKAEEFKKENLELKKQLEILSKDDNEERS